MYKRTPAEIQERQVSKLRAHGTRAAMPGARLSFEIPHCWRIAWTAKCSKRRHHVIRSLLPARSIILAAWLSQMQTRP
jgi:hypothetical protein